MRSAMLKVPSDITDEDAQVLLAVRLFEEGRVSLGAAAELAGFSVRAFTEVLTHKGIPAVDYPVSELADDLANA